MTYFLYRIDANEVRNTNANSKKTKRVKQLEKQLKREQ